jgi:hypothetical protein
VPELTDEEFHRIYGPIRALTPLEVAAFFAGATFRWWIAGGQSLELEEEPRRPHDDLEVGIIRDELPQVRSFLSDYHLWDTHAGALHFVSPDYELPTDHEQLWLRRDAFSPWLMDLMLTPVEGETWFYKRDRRISRPLEQVVHAGPGGIPYQRPEVTLLYKARRLAPKDELDFAATLPRLAGADREWLRAAIALSEPADHPWLKRLQTTD